MVRLKEQVCMKMALFIMVSIPDGAIKGEAKIQLINILKGVSIPDGAIKGYSLRVWQVFDLMFQFQMVRLKVAKHEPGNTRHIEVSIPDGAIKGLDSTIHSPMCQSVSIPDGAIKGDENPELTQVIIRFNSRWCD